MSSWCSTPRACTNRLRSIVSVDTRRACSSGYVPASQPEICSGDHSSASLAATSSPRAGDVASLQRFGRWAGCQARWSARIARYRRRPACRAISRLMVEGARAAAGGDPVQRPALRQAAADLLPLGQRQHPRRASTLPGHIPTAGRQHAADGAALLAQHPPDLAERLAGPPARPQLPLLLGRQCRPALLRHRPISRSTLPPPPWCIDR